MEKGERSEAVTMDPQMHSAAFSDEAGQLVVRWTRRKNRPKGSLLRRRYVCDKKPTYLCVSRRMKCRLSQMEVGAKIWTFTQSQARRRMVRYLMLLGVAEAEGYT